MNWSNTISSALIVFVVLMSFTGIAAGLAILVQIVHQGGWKLAEPSVIKSRWRMVRPWMLAGAVIGLLVGVGIVFLNFEEAKLPDTPPDMSSSPLPIKSRPRDGGQPTE
jgi:hypothetical protein